MWPLPSRGPRVMELWVLAAFAIFAALLVVIAIGDQRL